MALRAFVDWPSAPLTDRLVKGALTRLASKPALISSPLDVSSDDKLLQWSTYDAIDHELTLTNSNSVLSSSYTIRKALIRKHFLHRCIHAYVVKNPSSILSRCVPRTWDIDISFADELDEMWNDELFDLSDELERHGDSENLKWWILKPGMADRGMGIRLFNTKSTLEAIFEAFEEEQSDNSDIGDDVEDANQDTVIMTSQLRHFVIQEYLSNPVLLNPHEGSVQSSDNSPQSQNIRGHKFHLRAYCVASGDLTVYLYPRVLALFSSHPYIPPSFTSDGNGPDLRSHLTNTCLQEDHSEDNVRLLEGLVGSQVLSSDRKDIFTDKDVVHIIDQMKLILSEVFAAASQMPIHFQALPNAFELFGVDFLLTHGDIRAEEVSGCDAPLHLSLLEINAEPAIEMTGPRLSWVLEELFDSMAKTCVNPFFQRQHSEAEDDPQEVVSSLLQECYNRKRGA